MEDLTEENKQINELGQYKFCLADPTIKSSFLKRKDVIEAIIFIILDSYTDIPIRTPDIIKDNNIDLLDCSNKEEELIKELFIITTDEKDIITIAQVDEILKNNTTISKTKAKLIL